VTVEEHAIKNLLDCAGFEILHNGAPDFLCYQGDITKGPVKNIFFVEVKSDKSPELTKNQWNWISILRQLGIDVFVINPNDHNEVTRLIKKLKTSNNHVVEG
jgi:Icc-related predicted phosphoesterase